MKKLILHSKNLKAIGKHMPVPAYNRKDLKGGLVHIGVGGFHRSHQAYYMHNLLAQDYSGAWGICGIGLRDGDRKTAQVLKKQDYLYTLITQYPDGKVENEVIGAITDYILAVDELQSAIERMAHADTKIVSLTITEGGYNITSSGEFDFTNSEVQHDIKNPDRPKTVFGYLTAALKKRRLNELGAFTILSCDNVEHNGDIAKYTLLAFAKAQDADLAQWIADNVSFPNGMVDRITPATTAGDIAYLSEKCYVLDEWPVTCEPFIQWVVEDDFINGRPAFERVGVQFVSDVTPYEKMKLRLLNAGHSVLGIAGALLGHPTINACMQDTKLATFMRKFLDEEATPILDEVKGINVEDYKNTLAERFANPNIKDSVARICSESSAKLPKFLIPTLRENLKIGGNIKLATLVLAFWCYYSDKQVDQNHQTVEIKDVKATELHQAAKDTDQDTLSFLRQEEIFGDLVRNQRFTLLYKEMVGRVYEEPNIAKILSDFI